MTPICAAHFFLAKQTLKTQPCFNAGVVATLQISTDLLYLCAPVALFDGVRGGELERPYMEAPWLTRGVVYLRPKLANPS